MKKLKACCGFGHREIFGTITEKVVTAVKKAAEQGCELYYTGAMGEFDEIFSSAVRFLKKTYPEIKLVCVKPYLTKEIKARETLSNESLNNLSNGGRGIGNVVENLLINPLSRYLFDNEIFENAEIVIDEIDTVCNPPSLKCTRRES